MKLTVNRKLLNSTLALFPLFAPGYLFGDDQAESDRYKWYPGHYMQRGTGDSPRVFEDIRKKDGFIGGAAIYFWSDLEKEKGVYDFSLIEADLDVLGRMGKKLAIEIWRESFVSRDEGKAVPDYLRLDPIYKGGTYVSKKPNGVGEKAKFWLLSVNDRLIALSRAIAEKYDKDPRVSLFVISETSVAADGQKDSTFSPDSYETELKRMVVECVGFFEHTPVIVFGNWWRGNSSIEEFGEFVRRTGAGYGGPDLRDIGEPWPDLKGDIPGYRVTQANINKMATCYAVQTTYDTKQWYDRSTPPGLNDSAEEIFRLGVDKMKLNFVFWRNADYHKGGFQWTRDVIPYVQSQQGRINSEMPENLKHPRE